MDALSHLLSLYPIRTALDTRCRGAAAYSMHHAARAHGVAPYHLIVEGQVMLHMPGQAPLQLVAGDMLVLPRGQAHTLHIGVQDQLTDILCGQFDVGDAAAGKMISALPETILIRTAGKNEFAGLHALVNLLRDEAGVAQPGAQAVIAHLAAALFALILRAWMKQANAVPGLFALLADQRLAPVLRHMLMAPERNWNLPQLAQLSNMSRATFLRNFRRVAGGTPGELLMHIRMAQASQWLRQAHRSVADIGAAVGYQSEAAFSKAFKRYMGDGPGHYRRAAAPGR